MSSSVTAEGDEALTGLVVMEDGGHGHEGGQQACYLTFNSHPLVFHKVGEDEDGDNDGQTTTVVTVEYLDHVVGLDDPSSSIQFDDEHARAVANLLEFHNQQTNFSYTGGEEDGVEADGDRMGEYSESGEMQLVEDDGSRLMTIPIEVTHLPVQVKHTVSPKRSYGRIKPTGDAIRPKPITAAVPGDMQKAQSSKSLPNMANPLGLPRLKGNRRTIIDTQKVIPIQQFKRQLTDTSDIVLTTMDCAPPTKKAMNYLAYGGVGKYFAYSGRRCSSVPLAKLFFSRLNLSTETRQATSSSSTGIEGSEKPFIIPLNAELKTPVSLNYEGETRRNNTILPCQFNDAVAKRAANSFDSFCKGMTKPTKLEFSSRKIKPRSTQISKLSPRLVNGRHPDVSSSPNNITPRILYVSNLPTSSEVTTLRLQTPADNDNTFPIQHSITASDQVMYSIEEGQPEEIVIKPEIVDHTDFNENEDDTCDDNELKNIKQEPSYGSSNCGPSNFEMLIAAAEQHTNLSSPDDEEESPTINTSTSIDSTNTIVKTEILQVEELKEDEGDMVEYTNIVEGEQLIVLSDSGESFRVQQDSRGELTLWPHTEYDTNIFA